MKRNSDFAMIKSGFFWIFMGQIGESMAEKGKVLIVDDKQIERVMLKKILSDTYEVVEAENGKKAFEILYERSEEITAVLLDIVMPEYDGYYFLERYHKAQMYQAIPVVVLTMEIDIETEVRCLSMGAWDFIRKPYNVDVVRFRLKNVIGSSSKNISKALKYRAEYDILTGIYNKTNMFQATSAMLERYPDRHFAFVRMDIEKFQLINSFFGMSAGDELLKYIADLLIRAVKNRNDITFGRMDADIFCFCMSYENTKELVESFNKMRDILSRYPLDFDIVPIFGVYLIAGKKITPNHMYDRANLAAKHCKGNYIRNYAFYTRQMSQEIEKEQRIVNSMKSALENHEFVVYYQPKYGLSDNQIAGAEALVRWKHPERGMISPGGFIPVFERNGFITKLDYYVWEQTCIQLRRWLDEGKQPLPISVNLSRISLYNKEVVEVICDLVDKYQIPRRLFQVELTESAYNTNPKAVQEMMQRLREEGFYILMDDFGSGYSSLNVLKDIVVDVLKMDMKFFSGDDKEGRGENIMAAVIRMAKWLNMPVVAEGAERKEQVSFLRSIGCEYVQGFYFAKPMPVEEYEKLLYEQPYFEDDETRKKSDDTNVIWTANMQMEMIFSNMLQAAAIYEYRNGNLEVVRVNDAYFDLFGYHDTDYVMKEIEQSIAEEDRAGFLDTFSRVVENGKAAECEVKRNLDSGREIWIKLRLKYINKVGDRHIIFGCIDDITSQKEMDDELTKYRLALQEEDANDKTMLVVDDMEINRASLESIFEKDYQIVQAGDGEEALRILEDKDYKVDMILLDLMMPGMNGQTFMQIREKNPKLLNIPVVIITADDTTEQQVQTMEMGASDYIVKPFIPEIVTRRVQNVLDSTRRKKEVLQEHQK